MSNAMNVINECLDRFTGRGGDRREARYRALPSADRATAMHCEHFALLMNRRAGYEAARAALAGVPAYRGGDGGRLHCEVHLDELDREIKEARRAIRKRIGRDPIELVVADGRAAPAATETAALSAPGGARLSYQADAARR